MVHTLPYYVILRKNGGREFRTRVFQHPAAHASNDDIIIDHNSQSHVLLHTDSYQDVWPSQLRNAYLLA